MAYIGDLGPSRWEQLGQQIGRSGMQMLGVHLRNAARDQALAKLQEILNAKQPVDLAGITNPTLRQYAQQSAPPLSRQDMLKQLLAIPNPVTRAYAFDYLNKLSGFLPKEDQWIKAPPGYTLYNPVTGQRVSVPAKPKPQKPVKIYNKAKDTWIRVPENAAIDLLNQYPEIYTDESGIVTMSKLQNGRIIKKKAVRGSSLYNKLLKQGFEEAEISPDTAGLQQERIKEQEQKEQEKQKRLQEYGRNLQKAKEAIRKGAPLDKVLDRLITAYPDKVTEIQRILLDPSNLPDPLRKDIEDAVQRTEAGEDPRAIFRELAAKHPEYAQILRRILAPTEVQTNISISDLFNR